MKKIIKEKQKTIKGITLISLVITIIILIILAGISINLILGENGLFTKAKNASEETKLASEKEKMEFVVTEILLDTVDKNQSQTITAIDIQNKLNEIYGNNKAILTIADENHFFINMIESETTYKIDSYGKFDENIINWKMIKSNIEAPSEQLNKNIIGIGNNGKSINMDLWEFSKLEDGTYRLNEMQTINSDANKGYLGGFTEEGKIEGDIPVFISEDKGKTYSPVTSLENTFRNCEELVIAPNIPFTITNMRNTFADCTKLLTCSLVPASVNDLYGGFARTSLKITPILLNYGSMKMSFYHCLDLEKITNIPYGVTDLSGAFRGAIIKNSPEIPTTVIDLSTTFSSTKIEVAPYIPSSVENMTETFSYCYNLTGNIVIDANPSEYTGCFKKTGNITLSGKSTLLDELLSTK